MFWAAALLLATVSSNPMVVSSEWLAQHLEDRLVVVVEVGSRADYEQSHIPGARFIAASDIVADCDGIPNELPDQEQLIATFTAAGIGDWKRVVLYSRNPLLATRAWFTLDYLGHGSRVSVLDGGFERWEQAALPVAKEPSVAAPAEFTIAERPYSIMKLEEMKELIHRRANMLSKLITIDARQPRFYSGDIAGEGIVRAGHIPDAISIPWTANLSSEHPPLLRPADELRQIYTNAGVTREAIVITYCRTGVEASMTYFVLRYLGFDVALYDGSFIEWSRSKSTSVVARQ